MDNFLKVIAIVFSVSWTYIGLAAGVILSADETGTGYGLAVAVAMACLYVSYTVFHWFWPT
jgi:hypothetical protein